eukprot:CAMPEP_0176492114 /NCGR_PEP_ID=MMETSP0200_2-20121128/8802_1 /TAXON_ID=947934 /ORGANISM="Chaetoceros sp., Strain GSL56" /LENGTH=272 /DNA_ID=CAMNT_0017889607 /DNA_START=89 /DNA_END=907 /DNA_ORIENTATION=+
MTLNSPKLKLVTLLFGAFVVTHCVAFHQNSSPFIPRYYCADKVSKVSKISLYRGPFVGIPSSRRYTGNLPHQLSSFSFSSSASPSRLQMGYLPPGGNDKDSLVSNIIFPILTVAATLLFFLSPLGAVFFAVTNSIFLLLILLPVILSIGFQAWQYFYTISAPCPNCGAPTRVLKDDDVGPNLCLNCGSLIRANLAKDGVELCNDPNDIFDESSRVSSFFDLFTRDMDESAGRNSGGGVLYDETTIERKTMEDRQNRERRERTIIDVDATKDD